MKKTLLFFVFMYFSMQCIGQIQPKNDTIQFNNYIGIIYDSTEAYEPSRNIFPKKRFKPSLSEVKEFEQQFLPQYANAIKKHHNLFYKNRLSIKDISKEGKKALKKSRKNMKNHGLQAQAELEKEFCDYDRYYYGYIGDNGFRYLLIIFNPHKEEWYELGGELHLQNLPQTVYNLDKKTVSLSGWTGEGDWTITSSN